MKTIDEQIQCIRRELAMRRNVYKKWVTTGRMKQEAADHEIACMEAAHATLTKVQSTPTPEQWLPSASDQEERNL